MAELPVVQPVIPDVQMEVEPKTVELQEDNDITITPGSDGDVAMQQPMIEQNTQNMSGQTNSGARRGEGIQLILIHRFPN